MNLLVTGGAGYIGTHTLVELTKAGHTFTVIDNFYNSKPQALKNVEQITGKPVRFFEGDLLDREFLASVFDRDKFDGVIHFAAFKAVGESVAKPIEYYNNNLTGTLNLLAEMKRYGVENLVYSSSATVYGEPETVPVTEDFPTSATNPYGWTKWMSEQILQDVAKADPDFSVILLRYFNPVGAHESGLIGEDPNDIPNTLMPRIVSVAAGKIDHLDVFGNDYDTEDGTCLRDYIHVCDLAWGHCLAIEKLQHMKGVEIFNLGTGRGTSVNELIEGFERVNGVPVPHKVSERRPGDVPVVYADVEKSRRELGFEAKHTVDEMCRDAWKYYKNHTENN